MSIASDASESILAGGVLPPPNGSALTSCMDTVLATILSQECLVTDLIPDPCVPTLIPISTVVHRRYSLSSYASCFLRCH